MTMAERVLARTSGRSSVAPGEFSSSELAPSSPSHSGGPTSRARSLRLPPMLSIVEKGGLLKILSRARESTHLGWPARAVSAPDQVEGDVR